MKNFSILIILLSIVCSCNKESNNTSPTLFTGEIKGAKTGKLYLFQTQDSVIKILDSVIFDGNGKFNFNLSFEEPEVVYLGFDKGVTQSPDNNLMVFLSPGKTNLETTVEKFYADAKVTGSKNHDLWLQYKENISRYNDKNLELIEQHFKAIRNKNQAAVDSITNLQDKMLKRKYLQTLNFALQNKDFEIAPYLLLSEIPDANVKFLDSINKSLSENVKKSKYGLMLNEFVESIKKQELDSLQ